MPAVEEDPSPARREELTALLNSASQGDRDAHPRLLSVLEGELRRLARRHLRRLRPGHTISTTLLTHDAYLRLVGEAASWRSRRHFFGAASRLMRDLLVSEARRLGRLKRGGGRRRIVIDPELLAAPAERLDLMDLDRALERLRDDSPLQHEVVMLRYFGGLSIEEVAEVLEVSPSTVDRQWRFARAWLLRELS